MADFGEGFELCKIPKEAELIGVERHSEDNLVILTFKSKVVVYNIADRKIVQSWSVEAKERFTCPVVHHDESFNGVRDDEWLLVWDNTTAELWQSSHVMLRKPPKRIQVCSSRLPVLIYHDNEALPVQKAGKETKGKKTKERLLWCGSHGLKDNVCFSKVTASQDCTKVSLVMDLFSKSKQQVYNVKVPEESKICSWSLVDEDGASPFFVSLWSNGGLYKTEIPSIDQPESELCCEHLFNVCEGPIASSEVLKVHLSYVALSFICVATADTLSLWDTKFRTCHSQKALDSFMKSSASSGVCYLQTTPSYIILANYSCVFACSYTVEKSTLKSSLGVLQQGNKRMMNIKPQFLTMPKLIEPNQSIGGWMNDVEKDDEIENEILCHLLDSKKTKTAKKLASELRKHLEKQTAKESDDEKPTVSEYFVTAVFERCMKEKDLWSTETGRLLLKTHVLPQRCISTFFSLVLENNDIHLLQDCFQHLNGIPELTLVECLKFLLRCKEDILPAYEDDGNWTQINSPCSLSRAKYISLVLAHPINDAFLQNSLRKLQFEETLLFMKFLLHLMKCWSTTVQNLLHLESCNHKLSYAQVLDWAALTLNAHFTELILIPEAQTLLVNLHKVVAEQITTYNLLGELDGYLNHFKEHEPLPKSDRMSAYTIETMDL
ncbi:nucleolar protein 11-like isoform X2 [Dendronephthya gigantea]|uniref:nucleolar protein 11-like isoform X2 n=1 Tax=Dendronephthya gigantea TaxID=151771 RepID=UPI00106BFEA8|nr:nucleolar protein 11-like isoform X2 [Dendronephthya gigantea]